MSERNDVPLLAEMVYFLVHQGMIAEARVCLDGLEELRPSHPTTHLLNGLFYFALGKYTEAEQAYRKMLAITPDDHLAKAYLAESLIAQHRWREAESLLDTIPSEPTDDPAVRFATYLREGLREGIFQRAGR